MAFKITELDLFIQKLDLSADAEKYLDDSRTEQCNDWRYGTIEKKGEKENEASYWKTEGSVTSG